MISTFAPAINTRYLESICQINSQVTPPYTVRLYAMSYLCLYTIIELLLLTPYWDLLVQYTVIGYVGAVSLTGLFCSSYIIQFVQLVRHVGFIAVSDLMWARSTRCFLKYLCLCFRANCTFGGMCFQPPFDIWVSLLNFGMSYNLCCSVQIVIISPFYCA
jgi:hypothetical protein